jgi:hypothetical protein
MISVAALIVVMLMQRSERGPVLRGRPRPAEGWRRPRTHGHVLVPFLGVDLTNRDDVVVFDGF